jgi:peptidoglycan hydrolase-like protein with peptidoglycan-binding domain
MALFSTRFRTNVRLQAASENNPPLRKSERGEAVALLQDALVEYGLPMPITTASGTKPADGIYGDETVKTVHEFQRREGLQKDGIAGRQTLQRLDQIFRDTLPTFLDTRQWAVTTIRAREI